MIQYFTNSKAPTLQATYDATISSSTSLSLNANSEVIEVTALTKGIFMKWSGTASSSSFDEFIAADSTRAFVIPTGATTVEFIEQSATAGLVVIEK